MYTYTEHASSELYHFSLLENKKHQSIINNLSIRDDMQTQIQQPHYLYFYNAYVVLISMPSNKVFKLISKITRNTYCIPSKYLRFWKPDRSSNLISHF